MSIFGGEETPTWMSGKDIYGGNQPSAGDTFLSSLAQGWQASNDKAEAAGASPSLIPAWLAPFGDKSEQQHSNRMQDDALSLQIKNQAITLDRNQQMASYQTESRAGEAALAGAMANTAKAGGWTDPDLQSKIFEVGTKYPSVIGTPAWQAATTSINNATKAQQALDKLKQTEGFKDMQLDIAQQRLELEKEKAGKDKDSSSLKLLNEADAEDKAAADAKASGDTAEFDRRTARAQALRESVNTHGETEEFTGYNPDGSKAMSLVRGGKGSSSQGTIATDTLAQENIIKYANATDLGNKLLKTLNDSDVGFEGLAGSIIGDKLLAQKFPEFSNKSRITNRQAIDTFRNSMLRAMADDRSGRFSGKDREDVADALPSSGAMESGPDARAKIRGAMNIIKDRARNYADRTGTPIPDFAKNSVDIRSEYQRRKSALLAAVKAQNLTQDEALSQIDALTKKSLQLLQNLPDE